MFNLLLFYYWLLVSASKGHHQANIYKKKLKMLLHIVRKHQLGNQWLTQEFFRGGSTNSVEDRGQRERGSGGGSPLVKGSGGSCNLVQEISFHMVTFSSFLVL